MQFLKEEALSGTLVPVLLGASQKALQNANCFHEQYGVLSHLFCDRIPLSYRLVPLFKFHQVRATRGNALLLQALFDFAGQLENADLVLYLVPCTESYEHFVSTHKAELEGSFVLADSSFCNRKEAST